MNPNQCPSCCEYFDDDDVFHEHVTAIKGCCNSFKCQCGHRSASIQEREQHILEEKTRRAFMPCLVCVKSFDTVLKLRQHQDDMFHKYLSPEENLDTFPALKLYFEAYHREKVCVVGLIFVL